MEEDQKEGIEDWCNKAKPLSTIQWWLHSIAPFWWEVWGEENLCMMLYCLTNVEKATNLPPLPVFMLLILIENYAWIISKNFLKIERVSSLYFRQKNQE